MSTPKPNSEKVAAFIERWSKAEASERANYALFLTELCDVLEVPHPEPASRDTEANADVFDRFNDRSIHKSTVPGLAFGARSGELRCI